MSKKFDINIQGDFKGNIGDNSTYNENTSYTDGYTDGKNAQSQSQTNRNFERASDAVPTVFLSYSRQDMNYAALVVQQLEEAGVRVWWDKTHIPVGKNWQDILGQALQESVCMVLLLSPDAMASRYVRDEYRHFLNHNKPIYPVMCKDTQLPPELENIQYVPFSQVNTLIQAVAENCC